MSTNPDHPHTAPLEPTAAQIRSDLETLLLSSIGLRLRLHRVTVDANLVSDLAGSSLQAIIMALTPAKLSALQLEIAASHAPALEQTLGSTPRDWGLEPGEPNTDDPTMNNPAGGDPLEVTRREQLRDIDAILLERRNASTTRPQPSSPQPSSPEPSTPEEQPMSNATDTSFITAKALALEGKNPMPETNPEVIELLKLMQPQVDALLTTIKFSRADAQLEAEMQAQATKQGIGLVKAYAVYNVISEQAEHLNLFAALYTDEPERVMLAYASLASQRMISVLVATRGGKPLDVLQLSVIWAEGGSTMMMHNAAQVASRTPQPRGGAN